MVECSCPTCPYRSQLATCVSGEGWVAYHGDALVVLRSLAHSQPHSVDAVITDPPYGTGANTVARRLAPPAVKYVRGRSSARALPSFGGDAVLPEAWAELMTQVMALCLTMTKLGGSALVADSPP